MPGYLVRISGRQGRGDPQRWQHFAIQESLLSTPPSEKSSAGAAKSDSPWNRRQILRGVQVFVGLTLIGLLVLFLRGKLGTSFAALQTLSVGIVILGVAQGILDMLMGGLRIRVLVQAFGGRVSLWQSIISNGGNIFLGGLTPSQTGGGAAQLYVLLHAGVRVRVAIVASLVAWLGTILVFLTAGISIMLWQPDHGLHGGYRFFSGATVAIFTTIVLVFLLAIPKPTLYRGRIRAIVKLLPIWGRKWSQSRPVRRLEIGLAHYARLMRVAVRRQPWRIGIGFILSALIYLNKFMVAYVVLYGLGLAAPLSEVLYLQELQYLVVYFAPTPGASGLAELSAAEIMRNLVPADEFGPYVILWRTFTLYLPMLFGGVLLARTFLSAAGKPAAPLNWRT